MKVLSAWKIKIKIKKDKLHHTLLDLKPALFHLSKGIESFFKENIRAVVLNFG